MKTGALITVALGLISASAAPAQQCTYFEGGVTSIQSTFCNASFGPGSPTNYTGVYDFNCINPDGSYSTPTNDGYSLPGTGICEYCDACVGAAYAYCLLNPSNPAGCAVSVLGCLPNYCPPVFDFSMDTDFDTIWAQPEVTNQESQGTGISIGGVNVPVNICLGSGTQVPYGVYLDCGYQCPDVCDDGVEVGDTCGTCGTGTIQSNCTCSEGALGTCGGCGTYECNGLCNDPCADSGDGGDGGDGGGDGCNPDNPFDMCGGCCKGSECDLEYSPIWGGYYYYQCQPEEEDPVIIDLDGDGFALTSVQNGVKFDFFANHKPVQTSWTAPGTDAGWLVMDLNGNGKIDNGFEMFSNLTQQPGKAVTHVGFKALAQWDLPGNGGNGDGQIDQNDKVFSRLRLWVDKNHNGISEPGELLTMDQAGISAISLNYQDKKWVDAYGNQFRYRAKIVLSGQGQGPDHWAYDVILIAGK